MTHARVIHVFLALLVACGSSALPVYAQPTGYEGYQVVRIEITTQTELDTLRDLLTLYPDFELWSEAPGVGPMDVRVAPEAAPLLDATGLDCEVIVEDLQQHIDELYGVHEGRGGDFFDCLRTYDEHVQFMTDLAAAYPDLAEMIDLGLSVEGRSLWALRITGPGDDDKPGVMYHGAQHGNEEAGASVVAYAAQYILANYDTDPNVATLVDNVEWFLLPIMNPDGYEASQRFNANNVDLNRNWDGPGSGEEWTGGAYPFSEPETAAMRDFFVANAHVRAHIDFHGYINLLLWPWGHRSSFCRDHWTFEILGAEARDLIYAAGGGHYGIGPANTTLYATSGCSNDYVYGVRNIWSFCFEIRNGSLPDVCQHFLPTMLFLSGWVSDCDNDGVLNADEIAAGNYDCNLNGIPDECEADCNENDQADQAEIEAGLCHDCNGTRRPDACDIADGTSIDCDLDGVPDECGWDCNGNGIADSCDIADGTSEDCTGNGIPDECEPDCNENGQADSCDIANGTAEDCNANMVLDECELIGFGVDLDRTLLQLDRNHATISSLIPDRFDFSGGQTGYQIAYGGERMYDYGNRLNSTYATCIPYTAGAIRPAEDYFGAGSRYFTVKYDGLFIMIASGFSGRPIIRGNLGAAGLGSVDKAALHTVVDNQDYTVLVKRVFGADTPSVNHLFIARGDGANLRHLVPDNTYQDWDRVYGITAGTEIIYILVATQNGSYLEDTHVLNIANETLSNIAFRQRDCNGNGQPDSCDISDGSSQDLNANGIPDECECWGDLDLDNDVDLADLAQLLGNYGETTGMTYYDGDLDGDTDVDLADVAELLSAYGTVCVQCPGDLDGDNHVGLADLAQLLGSYGEPTGMTYEDGDLDGDGDVDLDDLAELLGYYGQICE